MRRSLKLLLALCAVQCVNSYVFSCEEVKNHLVNTHLHTYNTTNACVVVQEGFSDWGQLSLLSVVSGSSVHYFHDIARSPRMCVSKKDSEAALPWRVTGLEGLQRECLKGNEFTLMFTSDSNDLYTVVKQVTSVGLGHSATTLVVPQTGMKIEITYCEGTGSVSVFSGIGTGIGEERYVLGDWSCASMPDWILSFDTVITISADILRFSFEFSSALDSGVTAYHGDHIALFTTGRADDLQNLAGGIEHRARIEMANAEVAKVIVSLQLVFDTNNEGVVDLEQICHGSEYASYDNGTHTEKFNSKCFEIRYVPSGKQAIDIGTSGDNIYIDIKIALIEQSPTTTTKLPSTAAPTLNDQYCNCAVDKFGFAKGWNSNEIWLDIAVVLDTSEAMGAESLEDARELIESFISDGEVDFLVTDPTAPFYTRVGVISMADTATVLYNLNMTKVDKVHASVKKGLANIDINKAFDAAVLMLGEGLKEKSDRATTRQVIYYMTDSDPKKVQDSLNKFKEAGVIIVNNFLKEGETMRKALEQVASEGYFYSSVNYLDELRTFCKANCFCSAGKSPYEGSDPTNKASGGCYHPVTAGVPFNKAKTSCADEGAIIATVHDAQKGQFVQQLMSKAKSDYYWIGYEKMSTGEWQWQDQSTIPYTNWDVDEPSSAAVSKCAYVDTTTAKLPWGAGNCQLGFPYACQYAPCSVGNKNC